ncbi:Maf family nucleotide pyrophosphatase [Lishizhenia sp.]|uniref:Maf family nucleotide pyrophosphatase n=1 Tax=Lishizhenia sp. TaxID=2497594 RepID=UPI00299E7C3A|nr:Maf family nucleotide pyrophosphatase [Lishizhenia sp.]MDX1446141.1 Maf family nucleotide pyrophosphatase [Lishizhenia sp.]
MRNNIKIIIGSKSPRRQQLISGLGLDFEVRTKEVEEIYPEDLPAHEVAEFLSKLKSAPLLDTLKEGEVLLTSDTTVIINNTVLGKPKDLEEAKAMIASLSNNDHEVVTGVCLSSKEKQVSFCVSTRVFFNALSQEEIDYYVEKFQPLDKAGAYGIQEWIGQIGVQKIEGSYYNVVGLPIARVWAELKNF